MNEETKIKWVEVTDDEPREHQTVYLYRTGDLYPVVGARAVVADDAPWDLWLLEEGGVEDGAHRRYPHIAEGTGWEPTHYAPIGELPGEETP